MRGKVGWGGVGRLALLLAAALCVLLVSACRRAASRLDRPNYVAFAQDGRILVSDFHRHRIVMFDRDGRYQGEFGSRGLGKNHLWQVWAAELAPWGGLHLVHHRLESLEKQDRYREIKVFDAAYQETGAFPLRENPDAPFGWPAAVAFLPGQRILVADQQKNAVQYFTATGVYLSSFSGPPDGPPLDSPADLAVRDGSLWVVEEYAHRVRRFTLEGREVLSFGSEGSGPGQFLFPQALDLAEDGRVVVADLGNRRLQWFGADGTFQAEVRPAPASPGLAVQLLHVRIGPDKLLYAVDSKGGRVIVMTASGEVVRQLSAW